MQTWLPNHVAKSRPRPDTSCLCLPCCVPCHLQTCSRIWDFNDADDILGKGAQKIRDEILRTHPASGASDQQIEAYLAALFSYREWMEKWVAGGGPTRLRERVGAGPASWRQASAGGVLGALGRLL